MSRGEIESGHEGMLYQNLDPDGYQNDPAP